MLIMLWGAGFENENEKVDGAAAEGATVGAATVVVAADVPVCFWGDGFLKILLFLRPNFGFCLAVVLAFVLALVLALVMLALAAAPASGFFVP